MLTKRYGSMEYAERALSADPAQSERLYDAIQRLVRGERWDGDRKRVIAAK